MQEIFIPVSSDRERQLVESLNTADARALKRQREKDVAALGGEADQRWLDALERVRLRKQASRERFTGPATVKVADSNVIATDRNGYGSVTVNGQEVPMVRKAVLVLEAKRAPVLHLEIEP
jgi:hypothetical protein